MELDITVFGGALTKMGMLVVEDPPDGHIQQLRSVPGLFCKEYY